jgi:hypothetical protein
MSFTRLDPADIVISSDTVTAPAWSSNVPTLSTFFTASAGTATSSFYVSVYNTASSNINSAVQFTIAYGHVLATGSAPINSLVSSNTYTRINYGQYRNIVYGDNESRFNFGQGNTGSINMFAIQIDRNRYKESLMPGTFNLKLTSGSNNLFLTDDSLDTSIARYTDAGRLFYIVSGSNGSAASVTQLTGASQKGFTASGSYGLFLPDVGLIVLNPMALEQTAANGGLGATYYAGTGNSAINNSNNNQLFEIIQSGSSFQLNSQETVSSNYVFARVRNSDYNYTTNPSYITGSGNLVYSNFINNSQTYVTTVGMYNDNNELLAVAKLSKPLVKDFTKEALIRIKLDW